MGIFDDMENFIFDRFSVTKRHNNAQHNVQHRVVSISPNSTTGTENTHSQQQQQQQQQQSPSPPPPSSSSSPPSSSHQQHTLNTHHQNHSRSAAAGDVIIADGRCGAEQRPQQQQHRMQLSHQQLQRRNQYLHNQQQHHQHHHHHYQQQHNQSQQHITHHQQQQAVPQHQQRQQHHQQQQQQHHHHQQQQHQQQQHQQQLQQQPSHKPLQRCSSHSQAQQVRQGQQLPQHAPPLPVARSHSRPDIGEQPPPPPLTRSSPHSSLPNSPSVVPRAGNNGAQLIQHKAPARAENSPVSHRRPQQISHSRVSSASPFRDRLSWHDSRSRPPTGFSELHSPQQEHHRGFPSPATTRTRHRASWVELSNLSGSFDFPTNSNSNSTSSSSPHPLRRSASSCGGSPSASKPGSPTSTAMYNNVNNNNLSRPPSAGPLGPLSSCSTTTTTTTTNSSSTAQSNSMDLDAQAQTQTQSPLSTMGGLRYRRTRSTTSLITRSPSTERPPTPSSIYDNNRPALPPSPSLGIKLSTQTTTPSTPKNQDHDSPTSPRKQNFKNEKTNVSVFAVSLPSTFRSEPQLASLDRPACMVAGGGELPQFGSPLPPPPNPPTVASHLTQQQQQQSNNNGVVVTKFCRPKLVRLRSEPSSPYSSSPSSCPHSGNSPPSSSSSSSFAAVDPQSPQSAIRCRRRRRDELKRSQSLEVTSSGTCQEELWTGINVPNQLVITRPQLSRPQLLNRRHLSLHLDCSSGDSGSGTGGASCSNGGPGMILPACCITPDALTSCMSGDAGSGRLYPPLMFHDTHGDNIELLNNKARARRYESFCKGICFSNRPVHINEKVYVKFVETNTSWSGVLRFGFTSNDPATIQGAELPRYACPDLTNKPGNWAKALGERYTTSNILLHFSVNATGDVTYGVNGEEKGLFFSSVVTTRKLWAMLDVYGNTVAVEFSNANEAFSDPEPNFNHLEVANPPRSLGDLPSFSSLSLDTPGTPSTPSSTFGGGGGVGGFVSGGGIGTNPNANNPTPHPAAPPAVRFHAGVPLTPMPLHTLQGRHVRVVGDERRVAARLESEYCNSLVFSSRPLNYGETIVIQVLNVDRSYLGGLGFGLTACNPSDVDPASLPDDSDYLLDRLEYWVVNKDVCSAPEVGDELSFYLTDDGAVRYSRNNLPQVTLMHVDRTLPLWVFFDVYGNIQKIKVLGCTMTPILYHNAPTRPSGPNNNNHRSSIGGEGGGGGGGLTVAMPSSSSSSSHNRRPQGGVLPPQLLNLRSNSEPEGGRCSSLKEEYSSSGQTSSLPPTPASMSDPQDVECHVCYEQLVNCVIYKCGHMCLCYSCADQIKQQKGQCPICRNPITDIIKVYRS